LAAARFFPWVEPLRLPSQTSVVANGGRAERFVVRLPADRIMSHGAEDAGLRAAVYPDGAVLPESLLVAPTLVEHFKVRDVEGSVIGVAARHWTTSGDASHGAWVIVIPGRGGLLLAAADAPPRSVDEALRRAGYR